VEQTGSERSLEPFPAIDPEPPRRFLRRLPTARRLRWAGAGACLLVAGITAGALTWPWTAGTGSKQLAAAFVDHDGVIVFEEQPSGELGTARPDGSGAETAGQVGTLQGFDLPVVSPGDQFMVDQAGQVVALGRARVLSVTFSGGGAQLQANFGNWQDESFADGGAFITAAECDGGVGGTWQLSFASTSASGSGTLGIPVDMNASQPVAGDPQSEGAFAVPGSSGECNGGQQPAIPAHGDSEVVYQRPKQAPRTVVTAATLTKALGIAHGTPVLLGVYPSPDGSLLAVTVSSYKIMHSQYGAYPASTAVGTVIVTRNGQVVLKLPEVGDYSLNWSADSKRIATIASAGRHWAMQVWPLAGRMQQVPIAGHESQFPVQVLWSPDGSQLVLAWQRTGNTEAATLVNGWTVLDLRTKRTHDVTAPGQPAAWLPGGAR
jgi:hypothetical protein